MKDSMDRDRAKRLELKNRSREEVLAAIDQFLETETWGRLGFEKEGNLSRCGLVQKLNLASEIFIVLDMEGLYCKLEPNTVTTSSTRGKRFSIHAGYLVAQSVVSVVDYVINPRMRYFVSGLECFSDFSHEFSLSEGRRTLYHKGKLPASFS